METSTGIRIPVLPVTEGVVFPGAVVTLTLDIPAAIEALNAARAGDGRVVIVPTGSAVGALAQIENAGELPDGTKAAIVRTLQRAAAVGPDGLFRLVADGPPSTRATDLARELRVIAADIAALRNSRRLPEILRTVNEPGALADAVTGWSEAPFEHKVAVLEAVDVDERLELVVDWAKTALGELRINQKIREGVAEDLDKTQREYLLRQQMNAIRRELGEGDDDVVAGYRKQLADRSLPEKVAEAVNREIDRLERMNQQSPEHSWIRTWLDRIFELPWGEATTDTLDVTAARAVLDADHTGLDDVKDRIVEFLAVRKLRAERDMAASGERGAGAIVALVGPPGVGKTSLGESVARAMGRTFVRVSLGGVRDEAEVRGHRRTYVGAQPGRIARAIAESGTMNPVMLLDEVDKLATGGWSGDPSAALLEVLDPAQNHTFRDHYLEVDLDLSDVVFIATANVIDSIPGPLLDRMDLVRIDGYTEDEKVVIARDHLFARQLTRNGLRSDEVTVDDAALRRIVTDYTREAGVRSLERELGRLLRKVATKIAAGTPTPVAIGADDIRTHLGRARFADEVAERTSVPGVATGLAVTGIGGDVLFVEATSYEGDHGLVLTGQLGDVMKESAQIALSYVRSHADSLGVDTTRLERKFHVHVPAGAVPKDGPSAGVTMTTALVSLLTGRPVRSVVGMTGEVTLQGKVLPIGGVKQKVLAAHRAGLTEVVLPARNGPDLEDVPERVRDAMTVHLASDVADVLAVALEPTLVAAPDLVGAIG
ncbi:MAG: endopeptidase La [Acidimicrobiia bacterium]